MGIYALIEKRTTSERGQQSGESRISATESPDVPKRTLSGTAPLPD
jgi:hypothetical protein